MFNVGDVVKISKECRWYNSKYNPRDTRGEILDISIIRGNLVYWSNGEKNYYADRDLVLEDNEVTQQPKTFTGGIPEVGMEVGLEYSVGGENYRHEGRVLYISESHCILNIDDHDSCFDLEAYETKFTPLLTEDGHIEKGLFNILFEYLNTNGDGDEDELEAKEITRQILNKFNIALKEK